MEERRKKRKKEERREGGGYTNMHCRFSCIHVDGTRTHAHTNARTHSWWSI